MGRKYTKRNFGEYLEALVPELYTVEDINLSGLELDPALDIINRHISLADQCSTFLSVSAISGDPETERLDSISGISQFFVKQNALTKVSPFDLETKILLPLGFTLADYGSRTEFIEAISENIMPLLVPATQTDSSNLENNISTLSALTESTDASSVHNYLVDSLGWFYFLNTSADGGLDYSPSSYVLSAFGDVFEGKTLETVDGIKGLTEYLWRNVAASGSFAQFIPEDYVSGTADANVEASAGEVATYTSGIQKLDAIKTMMDVVYSPLYLDSTDTKVRDSFDSFIDAGIKQTEKVASGPMTKFLRIMGYSVTDISDEVEGIGLLYDIENCPEEYLQYIAQLIGWRLRGNAPSKWRHQLRTAVDLYKKSGTLGAIQAAINTLITDSVFDVSGKASELWESYLPHLVWYALGTESPLFKDLTTWTADKALLGQIYSYSSSSVEENLKIVTDQILLDLYKAFPQNFRYCEELMPVPRFFGLDKQGCEEEEVYTLVGEPDMLPFRVIRPEDGGYQAQRKVAITNGEEAAWDASLSEGPLGYGVYLKGLERTPGERPEYLKFRGDLTFLFNYRNKVNWPLPPFEEIKYYRDSITSGGMIKLLVERLKCFQVREEFAEWLGSFITEATLTDDSNLGSLNEWLMFFPEQQEALNFNDVVLNPSDYQRNLIDLFNGKSSHLFIDFDETDFDFSKTTLEGDGKYALYEAARISREFSPAHTITRVNLNASAIDDYDADADMRSFIGLKSTDGYEGYASGAVLSNFESSGVAGTSTFGRDDVDNIYDSYLSSTTVFEPLPETPASYNPNNFIVAHDYVNTAKEDFESFHLEKRANRDGRVNIYGKDFMYSRNYLNQRNNRHIEDDEFVVENDSQGSPSGIVFGPFDFEIAIGQDAPLFRKNGNRPNGQVDSWGFSRLGIKYTFQNQASYDYFLDYNPRYNFRYNPDIYEDAFNLSGFDWIWPSNGYYAPMRGTRTLDQPNLTMYFMPPGRSQADFQEIVNMFVGFSSQDPEDRYGIRWGLEYSRYDYPFGFRQGPGPWDPRCNDPDRGGFQMIGQNFTGAGNPFHIDLDPSGAWDPGRAVNNIPSWFTAAGFELVPNSRFAGTGADLVKRDRSLSFWTTAADGRWIVNRGIDVEVEAVYGLDAVSSTLSPVPAILAIEPGAMVDVNCAISGVDEVGRIAEQAWYLQREYNATDRYFFDCDYSKCGEGHFLYLQTLSGVYQGCTFDYCTGQAIQNRYDIGKTAPVATKPTTILVKDSHLYNCGGHEVIFKHGGKGRVDNQPVIYEPGEKNFNPGGSWTSYNITLQNHGSTEFPAKHIVEDSTLIQNADYVYMSSSTPGYSNWDSMSPEARIAAASEPNRGGRKSWRGLLSAVKTRPSSPLHVVRFPTRTVPTFGDLATINPGPEDQETVVVEDTGDLYYYTGGGPYEIIDGFPSWKHFPDAEFGYTRSHVKLANNLFFFIQAHSNQNQMKIQQAKLLEIKHNCFIYDRGAGNATGGAFNGVRSDISCKIDGNPEDKLWDEDFNHLSTSSIQISNNVASARNGATAGIKFTIYDSQFWDNKNKYTTDPNKPFNLNSTNGPFAILTPKIIGQENVGRTWDIQRTKMKYSPPGYVVGGVFTPTNDWEDVNVADSAQHRKNLIEAALENGRVENAITAAFIRNESWEQFKNSTDRANETFTASGDDGVFFTDRPYNVSIDGAYPTASTGSGPRLEPPSTLNPPPAISGEFPPNNSTGVYTDITDLSWNPNGLTDTYDVYFGTSTSPPLVGDDQTATTYDPGTLATNTTYYWRVDGENVNGVTVGTEFSFTTGGPAPPAPGQSTNPNPAYDATDVARNQTLTWDAPAVTGSEGPAERYDIYFSKTSDWDGNNLVNSNTSMLSYTPSTMQYLQEYTWRVDAKNISGTTTGVEWTFTVEDAPPPPGVPTDIVPANGATLVDINQLLSWTAPVESPGNGPVVDYKVYLTDQPTGPVGTDSIGTTSNTFIDPGTLEYDTPYRWSVFARGVPDANGNPQSTSTGPKTFRTAEAPGPPDVVTDRLPSAGSTDVETNVTLSWVEPTTGGPLVDYSLYFDTAANWNPNVTGPTEILPAGTTSWNPGYLLEQDTLYRWAIISRGVIVNGVRQTANPGSITFRTETIAPDPPGIPGNLTPADGEIDVSINQTLSWSTPTEGPVDEYDVYFKAPGGFLELVTTTTDLYYDPGTLLYYGTYSWKIVARGSGGESESSVQTFRTISLPDPGGPLGLPSAVSIGKPSNTTEAPVWSDLTWLASNNTSSYEVFLDTSASPSTSLGVTESTFLELDNLDSNTTYYWRVDSTNVNGTTTGNEFTFATGDQAVPAPVTLGIPNGPEKTLTNLSLSWRPAEDAESYDVYLDEVSPPSTLLGNAKTTYIDATDLKYGTTYFWEAVAKNKEGETSGTEFSFSTIGSAPPGSVVSGAPDDTTNVEINTPLSWLAASATTDYKVYLDTSSSPSSLVGTTSTTVLEIQELEYSTTYYWRVDTVGLGGSNTGTQFSFTTRDPDPPASVTFGVPNGVSGVNVATDLVWGASPSATTYRVYLDSSSPATTLVGTTSNTFLDVDDLDPSTTYNWRVDAGNLGGYTTGSGFSFTTEVLPDVVTGGAPNLQFDVPINGTVLQWIEASEAEDYLVYFGINPEDLDLVGITSQTQFPLQPLRYGTTYYWKVTSRNGGGTTVMPFEWMFQTESEPIIPAKVNRRDLRRRNFAKVLPKESYYERTGHNAPVSWDVSTLENSYVSSLGEMPLGYVASAGTFHPVVDPIVPSGVWHHCEGLNSSSIFSGVSTSATFPYRGITELGEGSQYVDRCQTPDIYITMHELLELKARDYAKEIIEASAEQYADEDYWKENIVSLANSAIDTGYVLNSFSEYENFSFGLGLHKLFTAYSKYFLNHGTSPYFWDKTGGNVFAHVFGKGLYNCDFKNKGAGYALPDGRSFFASSVDSGLSINSDTVWLESSTERNNLISDSGSVGEVLENPTWITLNPATYEEEEGVLHVLPGANSPIGSQDATLLQIYTDSLNPPDPGDPLGFAPMHISQEFDISQISRQGNQQPLLFSVYFKKVLAENTEANDPELNQFKLRCGLGVFGDPYREDVSVTWDQETGALVTFTVSATEGSYSLDNVTSDAEETNNGWFRAKVLLVDFSNDSPNGYIEMTPYPNAYVEGMAGISYSTIWGPQCVVGQEAQQITQGGGTYVASGSNEVVVPLFDTYISGNPYNAEFRNSSILDGVGFTDTSGAPSTNEFKIFRIDKSKKIPDQENFLIDNTFIKSKSLGGFPRMRFEVSDNVGNFNRFPKDHKFRMDVSALIADEKTKFIGGGQMGVWIHTEPIQGYFWSFTPNGWTPMKTTDVSREQVIGQWSHIYNFESRELVGTGSTCLNTLIQAATGVDNVNFNTIKEEYFDTFSVEFDTRNWTKMNGSEYLDVIPTTEEFYKVMEQVNLDTANYVVEVFMVPNNNVDKYLVIDNIELHNLTMRDWAGIGTGHGIETSGTPLTPFVFENKLLLNKPQLASVLKFYNGMTGKAAGEYTTNLNSRDATITSDIHESKGGSRLNYRISPEWVDNTKDVDHGNYEEVEFDN